VYVNIVNPSRAHEVKLVLTPEEARQILGDFDQKREPSTPGKRVYRALKLVADDHRTEAAQLGQCEKET
jgi:hypothetical protein